MRSPNPEFLERQTERILARPNQQRDRRARCSSSAFSCLKRLRCWLREGRDQRLDEATKNGGRTTHRREFNDRDCAALMIGLNFSSGEDLGIEPVARNFEDSSECWYVQIKWNTKTRFYDLNRSKLNHRSNNYDKSLNNVPQKSTNVKFLTLFIFRNLSLVHSLKF